MKAEREPLLPGWVPPLLILVGLIAAWQIAADTKTLAEALKLEPYLVPSPSDVGTVLWEQRELLADDAWVTFQEIILGFGLAVIAGLTFATLMHLSNPLRRSFYPLVVASQTIPIVVIAPITVVWFGFGIGPKLAIIALICFFPITVNTLDGLRGVDPQTIKMMRSLDASRLQIFRRVELPAAMPGLASGAKIAVAIAVIGAVFGEWAASDAGLGHLIRIANSQLSTDLVFAATVVLSAIAIALFGVLTLIERRFGWWQSDAGRS